MTKQLFTPKQIEELQKSPHVLKVSELTITYADTFKSKFIDEYLAGCRDAWHEAHRTGFISMA